MQVMCCESWDSKKSSLASTINSFIPVNGSMEGSQDHL
jgi:hypothetical protein